VNQIFTSTDTPYVLLLNPDIRVLPGSIRLLEEFMDSHPRTGAIGGYAGEKYLPRSLPTMLNLVMENLGIGRRGLGGEGGARPNSEMQEFRCAPPSPSLPVEQVAAAAMMIRREPYKDVPMFDEAFYPAWYEDVDFCRRLKRDNWEVYFAPHAKFEHSGGYSAKTMGSAEFLYAYYRNQIRYAKKWFKWPEVAVVRASVVAGTVGRIVVRPWNAAGYVRVFIGALIGW
jgi:GT2 family glycosyltransferase